MNKNTIIGFGLIAVILIGFSLFNKPSTEELARQQREMDSLAIVNRVRVEQELAQQKAIVLQADSAESKPDAVANADVYGAFSVSATGEEKQFSMENELLKLTFSNKGGRIVSAELKNYRTYDSLPLVLFDGDESALDFTLVTNNQRIVNTSELYFEKLGEPTTDADGNQQITLRLKTTETAFIDFVYTLPKEDYMVKFNISSSGMNTVMPLGTNALEMRWTAKIRQQEKGRGNEDRYSALYYKYSGDDVEQLNVSKNEEKRISNKLRWVAFKDQFFSSIFIADDAFNSARLTSVMLSESSGYLKEYTADMTVSFDITGRNSTGFRMFLGPNQYKILSAFDKGVPKDEKLKLQKLVPLGWGIFGWVNQWAIIPMFNLFSKFIANFGLIILLMTIVIKIVLFPLTYKSYLSSARMRVLKPEIDEINAKIPADKPAERQKATMELYKKVGVSPMSGCLPMLLQMPILIAMFSFFPASIELRQQSFLWASDLSTYDSIMKLPFTVPFGFGDHISLFTLLMTAVTIVYQKLNSATMGTPDQPGMGMMKWMMYLMPVMFMFWFNSYASGLTYYYFISTLISIAQTYVFRATIDEKQLLAQLHAKRNSKDASPKKKSGFMERLEKMQREQEKALRERNKKRK
ncbi:MAG: membrane protein insertase YidC [Paludibacter sp.]|jgi:YidC/Oxa1 family membrane protein insertase|nr:membrane protein insertase YidC [Paludibacter sp.]